MTAVDAIIRSCLLTTWDDRHGWTQIACTHMYTHEKKTVKVATSLKKKICEPRHVFKGPHATLRVIPNHKDTSVRKVKMWSVFTCLQTWKVSLNKCLYFCYHLAAPSSHAKWAWTTCNAVARSHQLKCQSTQQVMRFDIWHQSIIRPAPAADGACSFTRGFSTREAYWGTGKDKMTRISHTFVCLNNILVQCI